MKDPGILQDSLNAGDDESVEDEAVVVENVSGSEDVHGLKDVGNGNSVEYEAVAVEKYQLFRRW